MSAHVLCVQWKLKGSENVKKVEVAGSWDGWKSRLVLKFMYVLHLRVAEPELARTECTSMRDDHPRVLLSQTTRPLF